MDLICELVVICAKQLPKTDTFSKIDPYLKIRVDNLTFQTSKRDDEENPIWREKFVFPCALAPNGLPSAVVKFELWDEDSFKDSQVAFAELNIMAMNPAVLASVELPLTAAKPKYENKGGKKATITVGILGWIHSYPKLRSLVAGVPGAIFNDRDQRLYVPLPVPGMYVGVEYERDAVDIKFYQTDPNPSIYLDMMLLDRQVTKLRRRIYHTGSMVYGNLVAYQELKIDDLGLNTNFHGLMLMSFSKVPLMVTTLDKVVSAHGWRGSMGYETAKRNLHNIQVDDSEQEIYMSTEEVPPLETFLVVDWDKGDVDIKLGVLAIPSTAGKGFDLTIKNADVKTTSEIYNPPKSKLKGRFLFARMFELDDVPYGTSFNSMMVAKYELSNMMQWSVQSLVPIRPM